MLKIISQSKKQTQKIGELLGKELLKDSIGKKAVVIGLEGELGGGKTTFIQGLARGLKIKEKILSPTFVILKKFKILRRRRTKFKIQHFYHIDCYRLHDAKDLSQLGFKEIIKNPRNIVVIEWADRVRKILPKERIAIKFKWSSKNKREIKIS